MRQLCYYTLSLRDRGLSAHRRSGNVQMVRTQGGAARSSISAFPHPGHYGYTTDLPFNQRYADVMGLQIGDGTAQIQKLVIAREKVGRIAVQYAKQS